MSRNTASTKAANALEFTSQAAFYSFTIHNRSGISQSYSLFSHVPCITPSVKDITPHAILVARGIAPGSGSAFLTTPRDDYYSICGTIHQDEAVQMRVLDRRAVRLGSSSSGDLHRGTTCVAKVLSGAPSFTLWGGTGDDKGSEAPSACRLGRVSPTSKPGPVRSAAIRLHLISFKIFY
jgi:hypothetical protein